VKPTNFAIFVSGLLAGVAACVGIFWWGTQAQYYKIACTPDIKSPAVCSITTAGRWWNLDSGDYLSAQDHLPGWSNKLGEKCSAAFSQFVAEAKKWTELQSANGSEGSFVSPHFLCFNRLVS
jgi:hypothetical protein